MHAYITGVVPYTEVDVSIHPAGPLTVNENSSVLYFSLNKTGVAVRTVRVEFDLSGQCGWVCVCVGVGVDVSVCVGVGVWVWVWVWVS